MPAPQPLPELPAITLWTPSVFALLLSEVFSGGILGAANGVVFYTITGVFPSLGAASLGGSGLGIAGSVLWVLARRVFWGLDPSVEVGTALGLLYGIVPGLALLYQVIASNSVINLWILAGIVMTCFMMGILVGGFLDRITDVVIARVKQLQHDGPAEPGAAADRPRD